MLVWLCKKKRCHIIDAFVGKKMLYSLWAKKFSTRICYYLQTEKAKIKQWRVYLYIWKRSLRYNYKGNASTENYKENKMSIKTFAIIWGGTKIQVIF